MLENIEISENITHLIRICSSNSQVNKLFVYNNIRRLTNSNFVSDRWMTGENRPVDNDTPRLDLGS